MQNLKKLRQAFCSQRANAKIRGIDWQFTYEEWLDKWESSGKLDRKGTHRGEYNMSRYGDTGPYSWSNTFIQKHEDNLRDTTGQKRSKEFCKRNKETVRQNQGKAVIIDGTYYDTMAEAAESLDVTVQAIYGRVNRGITGRYAASKRTS